MTTAITFTNEELAILQAAVLACVKPGGGSREHTLHQKLSAISATPTDLNRVRQYTDTVIAEAMEAGEF